MRLPFHGKSEESFGNTLRAGRIIRLKTVKRIKNQQQKLINQTNKKKLKKLSKSNWQPRIGTWNDC